MAFNSGNTQGKQNHQAKLDDAAKGNINKGAELGARATEAARDSMNKAADLQQTTINKSAEVGSKATELAREGISKTVDLHQRVAENTKQVLQDGVETASHHAREVSERLTRTLGFSGKAASAWPTSPSGTRKPSRAAAPCSARLSRTPRGAGSTSVRSSGSAIWTA